MHPSLRFITRQALGGTIAAALTLLGSAARAQTTGSVGIGTGAPDASAVLDLASVTKGLLTPRMTASERAAIQSPARGLLVFQTDGVQLGFWYYTGTAWAYLSPSSAGDNLGNHLATQNLSLGSFQLVGNGGTSGLRISSTGNVGVGASAPIAPLEVQRDDASAYALFHDPNDAYFSFGQDRSAGNNIKISDGNGFGGTNYLSIMRSTGNVGIGTANATARLHVAGGSTATTTVYSANIASQAVITGTPSDAQDPVTKLTDGNTSSFWIARGAPFWATLDFGTNPRTIGRYAVYTITDAYRPTAWVVQGSQNGTAWTDLHTVSTAPAINQYVYYNIANTTAYRYYRFYITNTASGDMNYAVVMNEWQVMEASSTFTSPALLLDGALQLGTGGAQVTSISADPTLAGSSDNTLATQRAVKAYIDGKAGDNLGNHTATQNLNLAGNQLVGGGGTSGLRISSAGNVGIGASAPVAPLEVQRDDASAYALFHDPNDAYFSFGQDYGAGNNIKISDGNGFGGTNYLTIARGTGNVGIGTGSPQSRLHVAGGARIDGLAGSGARMVTTDNNGTLGTQTLPTDAQQLSKTGATISLSNGGSVTDSDNQALSISGSTISLTNGGSVTVPSSADNLGNHTATQNLNLAGNQLVGGGGSSGLRISSTGNVGIGASTPIAPLEVQRDDANAYALFHDPNDAYFSFGQDRSAGNNIKISDGNGFGGTNYLTIARGTGYVGIGTSTPGARLDIPAGSVHLPGDSWINYSADNKNYLRGTTVLADQGGLVGIGTASPSFPLDVQSTATPGNYAYAFYAAAANGTVSTGSTGGNTGPVSIRAAGRVVATEFNATSDRRLKSIIGLSDRGADLALLQRLRITNYTMRDKAQYGERQFKKVIAQEVEEVFPQAVSQHTGFLPDVYAVAQAAEAQSDSLLRLTLPAALPAAKASQRVKLIGPAGEVVGTVKAASGTTLLVGGARQLAGQPVFVFGLEHADVRSVDYEALAMLNVSATQELARKVQALEQLNARLQQQVTMLQTTAVTQAPTTEQLQQQAAQTAELAQRLKVLEALLGARAEAK